MKIKSVCITCLLVLSYCLPAIAMPGNMGKNAAERFAVMDTDKNEVVSREEFFAAMPNMREEAFTTIDADGNGELSLEEWMAFYEGHSRDQMNSAMQGGMPGAQNGDKGNMGPDAKPNLMMPARKTQE